MRREQRWKASRSIFSASGWSIWKQKVRNEILAFNKGTNCLKLEAAFLISSNSRKFTSQVKQEEQFNFTPAIKEQGSVVSHFLPAQQETNLQPTWDIRFKCNYEQRSTASNNAHWYKTLLIAFQTALQNQILDALNTWQGWLAGL